MRKIKLILLFVLFIPVVVNARSRTDCDYTLLSRLKKTASNINVSYTYKEENENVLFIVTINNLTSDMHLKDNITNKIYNYDNTNNGELVISGYSNIKKITYTIYSSNQGCIDETLITKIINLPTYNKYYKYPECNGLENYKICKKWSSYNESYEEFLNDIKELTKEEIKEDITQKEQEEYNTILDIIGNLYIKYYYLILVPIIVGGLIIIIIQRRKNRFKL